MKLLGCFPFFQVKSKSYPEITDSSNYYEDFDETVYSIKLPSKNVSTITPISKDSSQIQRQHQPPQQQFSLPLSTMHYITKSPSSPDGWQKLIQTCKYFYSKNSVVVCRAYNFAEKVLRIQLSNGQEIEVKNLERAPKLWVKSRMLACPFPFQISSIFRFEISQMVLIDEVVMLNQFQFFVSNIQIFWLDNVMVKYNDGTQVPMEKVIGSLINAKCVVFRGETTSNALASMNIFRFIKSIESLTSLETFVLNNIPETFNVAPFLEYIYSQNRIKFRLRFQDDISDNFKYKLRKILHKVHHDESSNDMDPRIWNCVAQLQHSYEKRFSC